LTELEWILGPVERVSSGIYVIQMRLGIFM
jgi:hypothetical protein